jgi:hypothetical protein
MDPVISLFFAEHRATTAPSAAEASVFAFRRLRVLLANL